MQASLFHNTDLKLNSKYCCMLDSHPFYTVLYLSHNKKKEGHHVCTDHSCETDAQVYQ